MFKIDLDNFRAFRSVGICIHDAGAANQIIALLKQNMPKKMFVYAKGPARKLWEQAYGSKMFCKNIYEVVDRADIILSGTGWATDIEKLGIFEAQKRGKICIAYFDHWTNYDKRLSWNEVKLNPNAIWVADAEAKMIAEDCYPDIPVIQVPNFYISQEVREITPLKSFNKTALYICEPIFRYGYRDNDLMLEPIRFALNQINNGHLGSISKCILRPHPSQTVNELTPALEQIVDFKVELSLEESLKKDICKSSVAIGYHSFALVVACAAGRTVFCSAPNGWPQSQVRLPELRYLREFL